MGWTKYQIFLACMLVATGSINTLATKFADNTPAKGIPGGKFWDGNSHTLNDTTEEHNFEHPFLQATGMFIGEFSCLLFFKLMMFIHKRKQTPEEDLPDMLQGSRDFNPLIFYLPALCDMVGTSLMYVGLIMTYPASFQMFRGAVIIFTGLFSMIFLKRRLYAYKWAGILLVLLGLVGVGLVDMLTAKTDGSKSSSDIITGDLIIVCAQVITATQMVLEEKFVSNSNVPALQAVGWEGLFGMTTLGVLLIPMYFIPKNGAPFENSLDGLYQITHSWAVAGGFFGTMISISFFNFAGVSVTKQISATTRMVLDSVRTIVIWAISIPMGSPFEPRSLPGFFVLMLGMMVYNNIVIVPFMVKRGWINDPEEHVDDIRPLDKEDEA